MKVLISFLLLSVIVSSFKETDDWFLLQTKSFKILFPKKPTSDTKNIDSHVGKLVLNLNYYEVPEGVSDDNHLYMTNETSYPDSVINSDKKELLDAFFKNSIAGSVNNVHGKLLSEKVIGLGKYPGREGRIDFRDGMAVIKVRMYLVRNTLFLLQTITETGKQYNKSIDKFMDSFQLVN
ncbi:MAG: hypothetical protein Q8932_19070 [Bacteroidota bacterium]|nr:hypothetical protein [Bacteroidota bacterium]